MKNEEIELTSEQKLITQMVFTEDEEKEKIINGIEFGNEEDPRELTKGIVFEDPNDPEQMEYLITYVYADPDVGEQKTFEFITGRKELVKFIKTIVEEMNLDESYVISDKVKIKDRISVYDFMKYVINDQDLYPELDFQIDDYR